MASFRMRFTVRVKGLSDLLARMATLPSRVRNRPLRAALSAAGTVIKKAAQQNVKKSEDTGWLRRSLHVRVQVYSSKGVVVAIVGPRTGMIKTRGGGRKLTAFGRKSARAFRRPSHYAHLIEFGVAPHTINIHEGPFAGAQVQHPGFTARPFLRPAWDANKRRVESLIEQKLGEGIEREAQRK